MDSARVGVAVFVKKDGKYIVGKRKGAHGAGTWCLPGGHVEFKEGLEDCCIRETMEETAIEIENVQKLTFFNRVFYETEMTKHYVTLYFTADYKSGELTRVEKDKSEGWEWVTLDDVPEPRFGCLDLALEFIKQQE